MDRTKLIFALFTAFSGESRSTGNYVEPLTEPFDAEWRDVVIDGTFDLGSIADRLLVALAE